MGHICLWFLCTCVCVIKMVNIDQQANGVLTWRHCAMCVMNGMLETGCSPCLPTERTGWQFFHGLLRYMCKYPACCIDAAQSRIHSYTTARSNVTGNCLVSCILNNKNCICVLWVDWLISTWCVCWDLRLSFVAFRGIVLSWAYVYHYDDGWLLQCWATVRSGPTYFYPLWLHFLHCSCIHLECTCRYLLFQGVCSEIVSFTYVWRVFKD